MNKTKQDYLQEVLETHRMSHIETLTNKYRTKRREVKEKLENNYANKVYSPMNSGSFAKHTSINIKFDLDTIVPFKKNSFDTLEKMFDDVFEFLSKEYGTVAVVRKQTVSIGIIFYQDSDGDEINLDIVPGREQNQDKYKDDKNLNLFVNSKYGILDKQTYIKTNIQTQIDHIKAKENERKIIRLLKIWKNSNRENYKSFLLELITIKAFHKEDISGNLWEKLKAVMTYIKNNVTQEGFTIKDPGNSSNNVIDTLESYERQALSDKMDRIIKNIESNEDNIKMYFPTNKDYEEKSSQEGYGMKTASVSASIPPNNTRFG